MPVPVLKFQMDESDTVRTLHSVPVVLWLPEVDSDCGIRYLVLAKVVGGGGGVSEF